MINNRLVNNPEVSYANVARQNQQYPHYLYQPQQASQWNQQWRPVPQFIPFFQAPPQQGMG